jgi:peptide/nickel transport system substrate-binding protein
VPGLAEAIPRVSRDGRTYRFRFRPGLAYSDGSGLRASDFERTVKRTLSLPSPGAKFFLGIAGAREYQRRHDVEADIPGITTDDGRRTVRVRLTRRDGTFLYTLASNFAAPVSRATPFRRVGPTPPAGIGPFRVERVDPGREIVLERSDPLPPLPEVPRPALEQLTIRIMPSTERQAQDVSGGRLDYMFDPVPADLRPEVRRNHADRYEEFVSNSTYYFWLNSSIPPFDDRRLRRAVHLGLDKPALARLYGGLLEPTCNWLPPPMPGYRAIDPCPYGDPLGAGHVARARAAVRRAGATGTRVTVWGNTAAPTKQVTEAFADQLQAIGFEPEVKTVSPSVYFQVIGGDSDRLQAGFGNWFQDFPHPASFMEAVRGDRIPHGANYNFSRTNLPRLTRAIKRLRRVRGLSPGVLDRWAALDRVVVDDAGVVPFGHLKYATFMSERMDFGRCSPSHPVAITDYTRFCLD